MDKSVKIFGTAVLFLGALVFVIPLATTFGAVAGYIVGLFFGDTILSVVGKMGLHDVTMWQLGACAGFFGGFLRTTVSTKEK